MAVPPPPESPYNRWQTQFVLVNDSQPSLWREQALICGAHSYLCYTYSCRSWGRAVAMVHCTWAWEKVRSSGRHTNPTRQMWSTEPASRSQPIVKCIKYLGSDEFSVFIAFVFHIISLVVTLCNLIFNTSLLNNRCANILKI